jgi:hypothetical protein
MLNWRIVDGEKDRTTPEYKLPNTKKWIAIEYSLKSNGSTSVATLYVGAGESSSKWYSYTLKSV